jgi:hypothetical protein
MDRRDGPNSVKTDMRKQFGDFRSRAGWAWDVTVPAQLGAASGMSCTTFMPEPTIGSSSCSGPAAWRRLAKRTRSVRRRVGHLPSVDSPSGFVVAVTMLGHDRDPDRATQWFGWAAFIPPATRPRRPIRSHCLYSDSGQHLLVREAKNGERQDAYGTPDDEAARADWVTG